MRLLALVPLFAATALQSVGVGSSAASIDVNSAPDHISRSLQAAANGTIALTSIGGSLAASVYQQAALAYAFVTSAASVSYTGAGSGAGQAAIEANTIDFGGSDSLLTAADCALFGRVPSNGPMR